MNFTRRMLVKTGVSSDLAWGIPAARRLRILPGVRSSTWAWLLAATLAFAASLTRPPLFRQNLYALQADAFLHGRLDVRQYMDDVSSHDGKYYVAFPPMPAVLLIPSVALLGPARAGAMPVALLLMGAAVFLLWRILTRLQIGRDAAAWLGMAFFLGTGYWFAIIQCNGVWFLAHVVAVTFSLLALEAAQSGRPVRSGLALGCAFLSRQMSIYAGIPIIALLLADSSAVRHAARRMAAFLLPLAACITAYLVFNAARFGHPLDCGYAYLHHGGVLQERYDRHGLFSPAYVAFNAAYLLLQGPHIEFDGLVPAGMDPWGTSLLFASPFVVLAWRARGPRWILLGTWAAVGLAALHMLCYYNNGWVQVNTQRFTLDFLPVLFLLLGLAVPYVDSRILRGLILYAVGLNTLAVLILPLVPRLLHRLQTL
jgi:hypothetical protein